MSDLEIPNIAREIVRNFRKSRQDCLTRAARIIVAAELRRMVPEINRFDRCILNNRTDELDPPERTDR